MIVVACCLIFIPYVCTNPTHREWSGPLTTPRDPALRFSSTTSRAFRDASSVGPYPATRTPHRVQRSTRLLRHKRGVRVTFQGDQRLWIAKTCAGEPFSRHSPSRLVACGPTGQSQWDLQGQRLPLGNTRQSSKEKGMFRQSGHLLQWESSGTRKIAPLNCSN